MMSMGKALTPPPRSATTMLLQLLVAVAFVAFVASAADSTTTAAGSMQQDEVPPPIVVNAVLDRIVLHERGALLTSTATVVLNTVGTFEVLLPLDATGAGNESSYLTEIRSAGLVQDGGARDGCGGDGGLDCSTPRSAASLPLARVARTSFDAYNVPDVQRAAEALVSEIADVESDLDAALDRAATLVQERQWTTELVAKMLHVPPRGEPTTATAPSASHHQTTRQPDDVLFDVVERAIQKMHSVNAEKRSTAALVANLTKRKEQLQSQRLALLASSTIRVLRVVINVVRPGSFDIRTSCVVREAGWSPSYELRFDTKTSDLVVHYTANVWQRSSANWTDVSIQLSTGSIEHRESVPELTPWRLVFSEARLHHFDVASMGPKASKERTPKRMATPQVYQMRESAQQRGDQSSGSMRATFAGDAEDSGEEMDPDVDLFATEVTESHTGLSDTFTLAGRHIVLRHSAAAACARLPIATLQLVANITTVVYPRHSSVAFLSASFRNDSPYSMLPGNGQAFVDGSLVGNVAVPLVGAGGARAQLPLGTDRSVSVTRRTAQEVESETSHWFFSSARESQAVRQAIITLENKRKHAVDVIVRELLPQPSHTSIVVRLMDPPLAPHVGEFLDSMSSSGRLAQDIATNTSVVRVPGMVEWKVHLAQGSKKTIPFSYAVTWPQEKTLRVDP